MKFDFSFYNHQFFDFHFSEAFTQYFLVKFQQQMFSAHGHLTHLLWLYPDVSLPNIKCLSVVVLALQSATLIKFCHNNITAQKRLLKPLCWAQWSLFARCQRLTNTPVSQNVPQKEDSHQMSGDSQGERQKKTQNIHVFSDLDFLLSRQNILHTHPFFSTGSSTSPGN